MSRPGSWRDVTPDPVDLDDADVERMRLEDYGFRGVALRPFLFAYAKAHAYPYALDRALACAYLRAARVVSADAVVSQTEAHEHAAAVARAVAITDLDAGVARALGYR